mmetsp:Transcript_5938/g.13373  ORF Transcript_5938/g.13373 Transcript_5938/m.13373 type:complete len:206 (-) Transcript_5938:876-1493(-)
MDPAASTPASWSGRSAPMAAGVDSGLSERESSHTDRSSRTGLGAVRGVFSGAGDRLAGAGLGGGSSGDRLPLDEGAGSLLPKGLLPAPSTPGPSMPGPSLPTSYGVDLAKGRSDPSDESVSPLAGAVMGVLSDILAKACPSLRAVGRGRSMAKPPSRELDDDLDENCPAELRNWELLPMLQCVPPLEECSLSAVAGSEGVDPVDR